MTNRKTMFLITACSATLMGISRGVAAEHYEVIVERGVAVKMRDGVVLRADAYRPKVEGKFPVLLERTPYNKNSSTDFGYRVAARGYVMISQDVRGRHGSEGEWYPFKHESEDGYDTIEWAAALPYSNGKVGMFGGSYVGATQVLAAIAQPPHLAGIAPAITASNYHEGWTYQGGAFEQCFSESWASFLAKNTLDRRVLSGSKEAEWAWKLPLHSYPLLDFTTATTEALAPYFLDWLGHQSYDGYWKQWAVEELHTKVLVPGYHVSGWYDIFMGGVLRNFAGIKSRGGSEAARRGQRLLIGPWWHEGLGRRKTGEVDYGPEAVGDEGDLILRWYDHLLKGKANGMEREKPVRIFVMGKNVWREEDDWPLARARPTRFYLHSGGKANSLFGDGTVSTEATQSEPADRLMYDPTDPVPTRGGGLDCDEPFNAGPFDQRPVESRNDVLVYSTPALKEDLEVTGPISVELYVSSSAVDTDFTAKLVDVWPTGFAQNLTDGILRARYRNSQEKAEFMTPGEIYKLAIDLWATSNVFRAGHKMRLEISSSNFPRFDRNLNTGEDQGHTTRMVKSTNIVYHDREHPSAAILPVVPR